MGIGCCRGIAVERLFVRSLGRLLRLLAEEHCLV